MKSFNDKYQYKNHIEKLVQNFDIKQDMFERVFAQVFLDIFEKEQLFHAFFEYYKISPTQKIIFDLTHLRKQSKSLFLLMFEDYQKLNNELTEIGIKIKKECKSLAAFTDSDDSKIDISRFIVFQSIIQKLDLKDFKPEQSTSPEFLAYIEANIEKPGLFFLYNIDKELMFIGKSSQLSGKIIDSVWEHNINGYLAIANTGRKADIHVYAPYYIALEKPLLNEPISETDTFSFELKPLDKSELIKIYI